MVSSPLSFSCYSTAEGERGPGHEMSARIVGTGEMGKESRNCGVKMQAG